VRGTLREGPSGIAYRRTKNPIPALNAFCGLIRSLLAEIRPNTDQAQRHDKILWEVSEFYWTTSASDAKLTD
jgi:hypothetical protein